MDPQAFWGVAGRRHSSVLEEPDLAVVVVVEVPDLQADLVVAVSSTHLYAAGLTVRDRKGKWREMQGRRRGTFSRGGGK